MPGRQRAPLWELPVAVVPLDSLLEGCSEVVLGEKRVKGSPAGPYTQWLWSFLGLRGSVRCMVRGFTQNGPAESVRGALVLRRLRGVFFVGLCLRMLCQG